MSQPKKEIDSEPSMEEILASIRKIISEDQQDDSIDKSSSAKDEENSHVTTPVSEEFNPDDVLELTEELEDPSATGKRNPSDTSPSSENSNEELLKVSASFDDMSERDDDLVDVQSIRAATSSLSLLANAVTDAKASLPMGNGNQTIEDLMKEVMKPMVKGWLDKNLPDLVERLVKTEIKRITRGL